MDTDNIFKIVESGVKELDRVVFPDTGCLVVCQFSGKIKYSRNGVDKYLTPGDCLVVDLKKGYTFSCEGKEESQSAYAVVDGTMVDELLELYHITDGCIVPAPDFAGAVFKIQKISGGRISDIKERRELAALYFHVALAIIDKARREHERTSKSTAALIRDYIDTHIEGRLQLEEISNIFFISKTQIFRLFKDAYGIAPMQYFLQKKIELAKQMLCESDIHISEIAERLSFTDAKHFSKTFKRFTGELPKNYRRASKSAPSLADAERNE